MFKKIMLGVRDYGLIDKINLRKNKEEKQELLCETDFKRILINPEARDESVCFLPWRTTFEDAINYNLIPKNSRTYVYESPGGLANPDPKKARELLLKILDDFSSLDLKSFDVLGYSIGSFAAFYIANNFQVKSITAVVPGSRLGDCIWESIATQDIKQGAISLGYSTPEEYDKVIAEINPMENTQNLPSELEIHLAGCDSYIPTKFGVELIEKLEEERKNFKLYKHKGRGHASTIAKFGRVYLSKR